MRDRQMDGWIYRLFGCPDVQIDRQAETRKNGRASGHNGKQKGLAEPHAYKCLADNRWKKI
jgi:hypothetical protein